MSNDDQNMYVWLSPNAMFNRAAIFPPLPAFTLDGSAARGQRAPRRTVAEKDAPASPPAAEQTPLF